MVIAALLLGVALALLWRFARGDVRSFARFAALDDSQVRRRALLRWGRTALVLFLFQPLLGLALLGRIENLTQFPAEFPAMGRLLPLELFTADFFLGMAGAILVGGTIGGIRAARRKRPLGTGRGIDISPLLPRSRTEGLWIALLASNAAVVEEVFFRLYLPLLLVTLGVTPWIAFVLTIVIFGLMHRYQGWMGVVMTAWLGGAFTWLYLTAEGLLLPILLHLALNLNGLLFRPWIAARLRRRRD